MKRVMILVLPTDWSPKNTSLYFAKADTGAIFFIPISDLSILLLFYYHSEIFRILGFKIGDLVSYCLASPRWAELSFLYRKFRVSFFAREMVMVSSLGCEFAIATMLSLFRTFLFGFYNFIWGTPTFGNSDFVWVQLKARSDQWVNLVIILILFWFY